MCFEINKYDALYGLFLFPVIDVHEWKKKWYCVCCCLELHSRHFIKCKSYYVSTKTINWTYLLLTTALMWARWPSWPQVLHNRCANTHTHKLMKIYLQASESLTTLLISLAIWNFQLQTTSKTYYIEYASPTIVWTYASKVHMLILQNSHKCVGWINKKQKEGPLKQTHK